MEYELFLQSVQTAAFCGQQGRISRTVRAILGEQFGEISRAGYPSPADQYWSLSHKAMLSQSVQ